MVSTAFFAINSLSLVIKILSTLLVQGGYLVHERFISYFWGGQSKVRVLASASSKVTLIQNNQYTDVAYFRLTYSEPL